MRYRKRLNRRAFENRLHRIIFFLLCHQIAYRNEDERLWSFALNVFDTIAEANGNNDELSIDLDLKSFSIDYVCQLMENPDISTSLFSMAVNSIMY